MVFIEEILLGFQISPSTFLFSFFCNFDFSHFFVFFLKRVISTSTQKKISDCKINALKVERVRNTFENLNFSEMTLKRLKTMQICQKCIFWGFHCFFAIFWFFCKFIKNTG